MHAHTPAAGPEGKDLHKIIESLEVRIAHLETHLDLASSPSAEAAAPVIRKDPDPSTSSVSASDTPEAQPARPGLEHRIGEFGLAWVGSIILIFGIVFGMAYTRYLGMSVFPSILGYVAAIGIYFFARVWKESIPHIYRINYVGSLLLLFYTTSRLHFVPENPLIGNVYLAYLLLLAVSGYILYIAITRKSSILVTIAMTLGLITALLVDSVHLGFITISAVSAGSVYLAITRGWRNHLLAVLGMVYLSHLLWLFGNPIAGNVFHMVAEPQNNIIYIFIYAAIFSWPMLFFTEDTALQPHSIILVLFNCLGFAITISTTVLAHYADNFAEIFLAITCFALPTSIILWTRTRQLFAPSAYAGFGFVALSITLVGYAGVPSAFFWLSLESLLVVSMALWFRSKILVVANSLIFLVILLAYIVSSPSVPVINFSFAFVALLSARIMNWQRELLTLQTQIMRNVYLVIAFIVMLLALHSAVPRQFVTLSWAAASVVYLMVSLLLKNAKYRWMAIGTLLFTVAYLLLVDLSRLDLVYRVLAFLSLGLMALGISLFCSKYKQLLSRRGE